MPQERDVVYGVGYTEVEPEPPEIDPATHKRDFEVARQIVRDAVPPNKKASKKDLVKLIRGWRADRAELIPFVKLKKEINALNAALLGESDPGVVAQLEAEIADKEAQIIAARPPDFVSAPLQTIKRLRRGLSISGPDACKSITLREAEAIVDEIIAERQASWTFLPVDVDLP